MSVTLTGSLVPRYEEGSAKSWRQSNSILDNLLLRADSDVPGAAAGLVQQLGWVCTQTPRCLD